MNIPGAVVFSLLVVALGSPAIAADDDNNYNEFTIRSSDVPRAAPRFETYPAKRYTGKRTISWAKPSAQPCSQDTLSLRLTCRLAWAVNVRNEVWTQPT